MSQLRQVGQFLFFPSRVFKALVESPRCWLVVVVVIAATGAGRFITASRLDWDALKRQAAQELSMETPGKYISETAVEEQALRALNLRRILAVAVPVVAFPIGFAVSGMLMWLLGFLVAVRVPFRLGFASVAHINLVLGLRALIAIPFLLSYPSIDPSPGGSLFVSDLGSWLGPAAFPGAHLADPFLIWMGVLVGLMFRAAGAARWLATLLGILAWFAIGQVARVLV